MALILKLDFFLKGWNKIANTRYLHGQFDQSHQFVYRGKIVNVYH